MPITSGAQGIIKMAMVKLWGERWGHYKKAKWLLQIHDSLLWETAEEITGTYANWAMPIMESVVKLSVPITVEAKTGKNWGEMTKWQPS